ncbi:uncharacterized protein LOC132265144 isoform X2 [Phlebotomus argentipes]|uniref:uncharacterized protein LOC132265144 isoform X2 n=1 Tax=Phlebotomus argentipes TaxID=94469 RepID=UPI0028933E64|nr:uncharacterized protein LOC132265144 isoform X2 [Phlebotomus argentipes]
MCTVEKTFQNINGKVLRVRVDTFSDISITILVENTESTKERTRLLRLAFLTSSLYIGFVLLTGIFSSIFSHVLMLSLVLIPLYLHLHVIESESVTFIRQFGLQNTVKYCSGRVKNRLIPMHSIHDIIINEVIQKQRVIFILQVLLEQETKETIFSLFEQTQPNLLCLEFIYNLLHGKWKKSSSEKSQF